MTPVSAVQEDEQVQLSFEGFDVSSSRFSLQAVSGLVQGEPLTGGQRVRVVTDARVASINHPIDDNDETFERIHVLKAIESRVVPASETCAHCGKQLARPRLAVPFDIILDAYERTGSVRGAAEDLTISRWAVERRLVEAGVDVMDRDEALAQVRLLRAAGAGPTRTVERTEVRGTGVIGCTVITFRKRVAVHPCAWPSCEAESVVGAVCEEHAEPESKGWGCAWPGCTQDALSGTVCYEHRKIADGLIEA